jgi:alkanesulfonate monooxygenase SsuD/methylene tetrahydromethanopterin reductase-like flavin-dependent oxidoreductase (luciferase family)
MKIDLLYELATDKPFDPAADRELMLNCLEQIGLADRLGFGTVWEVEHHFLTEFSHSSAPEVFLGAVTQRTERIRIGAGVTLLPFPFNHPIRVAERIATLDLLSGGRVEFGTGRSSEFEQQGFGISPQESRAMWQEALQIIPRMWQERPFSYEGRFFSIPEREIQPQPLQRPHPPIWLACTSPESWRLAALNGVGALGFSFLSSPGEFRENVETYRANVAQAEPVGAFLNDKVGAFTMVHCGDDAADAVERGLDGSIWYSLRSYELLLPRTVHGGWQSLSDYGRSLIEKLSSRSADMGRMMHEHNAIVLGNPDDCIEKVKAYEAMGIDHLLCLMQMRGLPHADVMRSIELFGREVIPALEKTPAA